MAKVTATATIVRPQARPTLELRWDGDYLNPRPHAALLHRIAAHIEERSNGRMWKVHVDVHADTIALELMNDREAGSALELLEEVAAKVNRRSATNEKAG
jgi:hypothetical protein